MVAPISIPSPRGKQIKTDRIDAAHLAQFYANGLLTMASLPETQQEQDRDLMRSRKKSQKLQGELRRYIHAYCVVMAITSNSKHIIKLTEHYPIMRGCNAPSIQQQARLKST